MLKDLLPRIIWFLFKRSLTTFVHRDKYSKDMEGMLKFAFVDLDGVKYYTFDHDMIIPVEREGKMQEYLMWMGAGLSQEQLYRLCDKMDELLTEGLKTGKNAATIGVIINEIKNVRGEISHVDLIYNYLAVQYVREGENPKKFNQSVQSQKVEAFKRGAETNDSFFFQIPHLESLSKLLSTPSASWSDILKEYQLNQTVLDQKIDYLSK